MWMASSPVDKAQDQKRRRRTLLGDGAPDRRPDHDRRHDPALHRGPPSRRPEAAHLVRVLRLRPRHQPGRHLHQAVRRKRRWLQLHRRQPAWRRLLQRHLRLLPARGGQGRGRGHRLDPQAAVEQRQGRDDRQELSRHHAAVRRRRKPTRAAGHRPGALLRRRLPGRRPPRWHPELRLRLAVELRRPAVLRPRVQPPELPPAHPPVDPGPAHQPVRTAPVTPLRRRALQGALPRPEAVAHPSLDPCDRVVAGRAARVPGHRPARTARRPQADQLVARCHQRRPRHDAHGHRLCRPARLLRLHPQGQQQRLGQAPSRQGLVGQHRRRSRAHLGDRHAALVGETKGSPR